MNDPGNSSLQTSDQNSEPEPNSFKLRLLSKLKRKRSRLAGVIYANLAGVLTMLLVMRLFAATGSSGRTAGLVASILASQIVAIPMGMGLVASFFWRKHNLTNTEVLNGVFFVTALSIVCSFYVLREGVICLIIVSPLFYGLIWAGAALGKVLWKRNPWLGASTLPLLAIGFAVDANLPHHHAAIVADEVRIHAAPAQVWRYIAQYPAIAAPPDYWLWRIGLPVPVQSTAEGAFVGARRDCRFSGNVVFEEKIVAVEPGRVLTFDVTKQPDHPELTGHFNLDRGRFELYENRDGTTTLIGTTWYRLHVYPSGYFDLWASDIIRHVHFRVMNHIKALAECDARSGKSTRHHILQ